MYLVTFITINFIHLILFIFIVNNHSFQENVLLVNINYLLNIFTIFEYII